METAEESRASTSQENVRQALQFTAASAGAALLFGSGVWEVRGAEDATAWFAAYILEQSLSVDNLFVFSLIFDYFRTPAASQGVVLRYGLIAAVVLRATFIVAGLALVERFKIALLPCALILLYSAYGLLQGEEEEEDLADNAVVQLTKKYLPSTDAYDGDNFFVRDDAGALLATPLLLALVCVELSDVIFAVDSVPAVFGVTTDPFIAFTSNGFAILGLRQLYTLISEAVNSFSYLRPAIAVVLAFIGAKLLLGFADIEISTVASLVVVAGCLSAGIGASIWLPPPESSDASE